MEQIDFNELTELEIFAEMVKHLYYKSGDKSIKQEIERLYRVNYNYTSEGVVEDMLSEINEIILSEIRDKCFNIPKGLSIGLSNTYVVIDDWIYCEGEDWDTKTNPIKK